MARQHATPLLLGTSPGSAQPLVPLSLGMGEDAVSEAAIQRLIHDHPSCLPIAEIDPLFIGPVPVCMELNTPAGPIDNFMVTPSGLPILVECKLWRNPEMRRQVVSQILDYAKELSRWSSSDLQREASRRLGRSGNALLELVREAGHQVDEADFNDTLTANLRRGRFLLLIVGDGIREGVEAIAEYLQQHAGLHFTLGLVELPVYLTPAGDKLVLPRILARTTLISREVIAVPEGFTVQDGSNEAAETSPRLEGDSAERLRFMNELVEGIRFSDPEQAAPKPTPKGYLFLYMPAPKSSCWINVSIRRGEIGLWLAANRDTLGDRALQRLAEDWQELREQLSGSAALRPWANDPHRFWIAEFRSVGPLTDDTERTQAMAWLRERMNTWVSVLRPRIRAAIADLQAEQA